VNRKGFISIIVVITLALIGLMIIQSYWIKSAITVKEANFVRDVNEAISGVVNKLERIEAANEFNNQMNLMQQRQKWFQTLDSLNQSYMSGTGSYTDANDVSRILNKSMIMHDVLENMFFDYRNVPIEKRIVFLSLLLVVVSLLARYISVLIPSLVIRLKEEITRNTILILTWGGLRGGISIALALSIPAQMNKDIWVTMTYVIVCFSILVQGLTIGKLARNKIS